MWKYEDWIFKVSALDSSYGTAFAISPNQLVTCRHVLGEYPDRPKTRWAGLTRESDWIDTVELADIEHPPNLGKIRSHRSLDLAILEYEGAPFSKFAALNLGIHQFLQSSIQAKIVGYSSLNGSKLSDKNVSLGMASFEGGVHSMLRDLVHAPERGVSQGYSGCPMIRTDGPFETVVAMTQLGGKGAASATYLSSDCIVKFMLDCGYWPQRSMPMNASDTFRERAALASMHQQLVSELLGIQSEFKINTIPFVVVPPGMGKANGTWNKEEADEPFAISAIGLSVESTFSLEKAFQRAKNFEEALGLPVSLSTVHQFTLASGIHKPTRQEQMSDVLSIAGHKVRAVPGFNLPESGNYCWVDSETESQFSTQALALGVYKQQLDVKQDRYEKARPNREFRLSMPLKTLIELRDSGRIKKY